MIFTCPSLPYAYNALEPWIDSRTMEIHHTRHHQGYVDKLNEVIANMEMATEQEIELLALTRLLKHVSKHSMAVRNNAGGHFNHLFFWDNLTPHKLQPGAQLCDALERSFGSFEIFKQAFTAAAATHFGSGWVWLLLSKKEGRLIITSTVNQDNPLMDVLPIEQQGIPILGLDIWEHAYYLLYENRRLAYIESFWAVIQWEKVENRFLKATKSV